VKYVKRAIVVGYVFYGIGWLLIPIPHVSQISAAAGAIGTLLLIASGLAWSVTKVSARKLPDASSLARGAIRIAIFALFPFVVVALASNGTSLLPFHDGNGYNWQHWLVGFLASTMLCGLYLTVAEVPLYLHKYVPWNAASEKTRRLLTSWTAGAASALTSSVVISMHFAGGPIKGLTAGQVIIVGFAVAVLLAPFFKWFFGTAWNLGFAEMFSVPKWRADIQAVISDVDIAASGVSKQDLKAHLEDCRACKSHVKTCKACPEMIDAGKFCCVTHLHSLINELELDAVSGESSGLSLPSHVTSRYQSSRRKSAGRPRVSRSQVPGLGRRRVLDDEFSP
jgi:hypothetical protein